jgi:hypothetical protein
VIVIDVEIEKAILGRNEEQRAGIEYCGGWRDFAGMGISVACTFDTETNLSRCFFADQMRELQAYLQGKPTAGFNTRRFDLPLLKHHGVEVDQAQHLDVLEGVWLALGLDPDNFVWQTHGGWSLDNIMQSVFGVAKSGNGAMAPVWWQQGNRGRVVDYCLRDVWLEAMLVRHVLDGKPLKKSALDEPVTVRWPQITEAA